MQRELYFEVTTMGHFSDKPALVREDKPVEPGGCHWFGSCDGCRWEDCIVSNPVKYASERGKRMRGAALAGMLQSGMPVEWLAKFFGMTEEQIIAEADQYVARPTQRRNTFTDRQDMIAEAVRRRLSGEPEMHIASDLGVSPRQVRRWCKGVAGIKRDDGRRLRGQAATVPAVTVSATTMAIQRRCDVVRCAFE